MSRSWDQRIRAIADDHHAPSSTLALRSGELLVEVAAEDPELLGEVTRALVLSLPAMASVTNVANVALRAVEQLGLQSVDKALQSLREALEADRRAAAGALCERLHEPVSLVTLGRAIDALKKKSCFGTNASRYICVLFAVSSRSRAILFTTYDSS